MRILSVTLLLATLITLTANAHAQIVENTQIFAGGSNSLGDFELLVLQDTVFNDPTSVFGDIELSENMATLLFTTANLDEGADWYSAEHCEVLSAESIAAGNFENAFSAPLQVTINESFFLGVNTGTGFSFSAEIDDVVPNRDVFGWGEFLVNENGELSVLDSAIAYDGFEGIVIGKNQAVAIPEPASSLLVASATVMCLANRRRS